jgi:hypothetical protein
VTLAKVPELLALCQLPKDLGERLDVLGPADSVLGVDNGEGDAGDAHRLGTLVGELDLGE